MWRKVLGSAVMALAASPGVGQPGGGGPPPASVVVDAAREEVVTRQREATGEVRTRRRSVLASQAAGLVVALPFDAGEAVAEGAVVARLDDEAARIELERAEARVAAAEAVRSRRAAQVELARRNLSRARSLKERSSLSTGELDQFETDASVAEAELAEADADLAVWRSERDRAAKTLRDMSIAAPFAGRVVRRATELGEWITPGDGVIELVSLDLVEAVVDVPESVVGYLEPGTEITLRIPGLGAEATRTATLAAVVPDADRLSRLFPVRLSVPNGDGALRPGMSVTALVPTGDRAAMITVHKDAILRDEAGALVYLASPFDSPGNPAVTAQAVAARVEPLFAIGDRVVIRRGRVSAGDRLLIEGNERVFPTQPLIILDRAGGAGDGSGGGGGDGTGGVTPAEERG